MRLFSAMVVASLLALPVSAQTTGVSGVNDLTINGVGSGAISPVDPALNNLVSTLTMSVSAAPGDTVIGASADVAMPGIYPISGGYSLDINPGALEIFLQPGSVMGLPLDTTVPSSGTYALSLPVSLPGGFSYALQFALLGPGFPGGIGTTQAHAGVVASIPSPVSVYASTIGLDLSPLSDDGNVNVVFANPAGFTFYGTAYSDVFVNMNGNLTFGTADSDFSPSEGEMLSDQARIAPTWDDWTPSDANQGTVRVYDDGSLFEVEWFDVRHYGTASCGAGQDSNTFGAQLDYALGQIEIKHQVMLRCTLGTTPSADQLVGISPGSSLSAANNVDLSAPGGYSSALPMEAIYEAFGLAVHSPQFDLGHWAGSPSNETTLTFIGSGGVGVGPYIQF